MLLVSLLGLVAFALAQSPPMLQGADCPCHFTYEYYAKKDCTPTAPFKRAPAPQEDCIWQIDGGNPSFDSSIIATFTSGNNSLGVETMPAGTCYPILPQTCNQSLIDETIKFAWPISPVQLGLTFVSPSPFYEWGSDLVVYFTRGTKFLSQFSTLTNPPDEILCTRVACVSTWFISNQTKLVRQAYVDTTDTTSPVSWIRFVDTVYNLGDFEFEWFDASFVINGQLAGLRKKRGELETNDFFSLTCDEAVGKEKEASTPGSLCPRSRILVDQLGERNTAGILFQGTPPSGPPGDTDWKFHQDFSVTSNYFLYKFQTKVLRVEAGKSVSQMYFLFQAGPSDSQAVAEAIDMVLSTPSEFYNGDDYGHPFFQLLEDRWEGMGGWDN